MTRNKVTAIESIAVMLVLILFALTVFVVTEAGAAAFGRIASEKNNTEAARVAFSYIHTKVRQNDAAALISVVRTDYGDALRIAQAAYETYIFFADGALYECLTLKGTPPLVAAASLIVKLDGFDISCEGRLLRITCVVSSGGGEKTFDGMIGLRT